MAIRGIVIASPPELLSAERELYSILRSGRHLRPAGETDGLRGDVVFCPFVFDIQNRGY